MKEWFKARNVWGAGILSLTDEEAGRFVKALWKYTMTGETVELSGAEKSIMAIAMMTLTADEEAANALSATRAAAGSKGGLQKVANLANATFTTPIVANDSNCLNKNKNKNIEKEKEKEINNAFDRFWEAYPRKEAKQTAKKAFEKLNPDKALLQTMLEAIERFKGSAQWQEENGRFIPHPATWINQRRWEDDLPAASGPKAGQAVGKILPAQQYTQRDYSGFAEDADDALERAAQYMA